MIYRTVHIKVTYRTVLVFQYFWANSLFDYRDYLSLLSFHNMHLSLLSDLCRFNFSSILIAPLFILFVLKTLLHGLLQSYNYRPCYTAFFYIYPRPSNTEKKTKIQLSGGLSLRFSRIMLDQPIRTNQSLVPGDTPRTNERGSTDRVAIRLT